MEYTANIEAARMAQASFTIDRAAIMPALTLITKRMGIIYMRDDFC